MTRAAIGIACASLALTSLSMSPSRADPAAATLAQGSGRPPAGILGTLDPSTGTFTPDSQHAAAPENRGTLTLQFDLDGKRVASVSAQCTIYATYTVLDGADQTVVGNNNLSQFFLDYDSKSHVFSGTKALNYPIPSGSGANFVALVSVECQYYNGGGTAYSSKYQVHLAQSEVVKLNGALTGM